MPTLYILQGIAGAGKTTLAKKMIAEGKADECWEADMWMIDENGNYNFNLRRLGYCHGECKLIIEYAMRDGKNLIQSNTNLHRKDVNQYLELAKQYGYQVVIICLHSDWGSIHNVPPDKIEQMKRMMAEFDWKDLPDFVTVEEYEP